MNGRAMTGLTVVIIMIWYVSASEIPGFPVKNYSLFIEELMSVTVIQYMTMISHGG